MAGQSGLSVEGAWTLLSAVGTGEVLCCAGSWCSALYRECFTVVHQCPLCLPSPWAPGVSSSLMMESEVMLVGVDVSAISLTYKVMKFWWVRNNSHHCSPISR